MIDAGRLRHVIEIQKRVDTRAPTTGLVQPVWQSEFPTVRADYGAVSMREQLAAGARQAVLSGKFTIRYQTGITPLHRVKWGTRLFNIEGLLPDPDSGVEGLVVLVSEVYGEDTST